MLLLLKHYKNHKGNIQLTKKKNIKAAVRHEFIDEELFLSFNTKTKQPDKIFVLKFHY